MFNQNNLFMKLIYKKTDKDIYRFYKVIIPITIFLSLVQIFLIALHLS